MNLVKFFVELRYRQPHKLFRVYEDLYVSLVGQPSPEKEPVILPGFGLHVKEKRMRVVIDPQRSVVDLEHVPNIGYCLDTITQVFRKVNELVPLPGLLRLGARSYWFKGVEMGFSPLVSKCKEKMFVNNTFLQNAIDVGASFVIINGDYKANVSFGPMELSQLKSMLFSDPGELPQVLTFLDVDYSLMGSEVRYTERELRGFAKRALDFSNRQGKILEELLAEVYQ